MYRLYIVSNHGAFGLADKFSEKQQAVANADYIALHLMQGQVVEVWTNVKSDTFPCHAAHGVK